MGNRIDRTMPALSIRQPFVEQILLGIKRFEYRSLPTRMRCQVYLYASRGRVDDPAQWRRCGLRSEEAPRGVLVGTVEIVGCSWDEKRGCYRWHLNGARRMKPVAPRRKPQPVWFYPFRSAARAGGAAGGARRSARRARRAAGIAG